MRARVASGGLPLGVAAVLTALAIGAVDARMGEEWGLGTFFIIHAVATAALLGAGFVAAKGHDRPDGAASALLVSGLLVSIGAFTTAAAQAGDGGAGWVAVVALAFAASAAAVASTTRSPACALLAAAGVGIAAVAAVAAVDQAFDPDGVDAFRWTAVALAALFAVGAVALRDSRMSAQLVNAAGVAIFLLAASLPGELFAAGFAAEFYIQPDIANGWSIASFAGGAGLLVYAIARRASPPAYLGAFTLVCFATETVDGTDFDPTLGGWPLVLIGLAVAATAFALLRPVESAPGATEPADVPGG